MPIPVVWTPAGDLRGLVDLGYFLRVGVETPPVVPDARAGLVWLSDGTLRVCGPESRAWRPQRVGVDVVGVRLSLGAVPVVLGVPALDLLDRRMHLAQLWGPAALELAERVGAAPGPRARVLVLVLQDVLRARRVDADRVDRVARHVARRLAGRRVRVSELAEEVRLSERQLRRRCEVAFGYPPSLLARLLRLHRYLALARASPASARVSTLAAAAGYADQAHLARDSRALTGRAPSAFLTSASG